MPLPIPAGLSLLAQDVATTQGASVVAEAASSGFELFAILLAVMVPVTPIAIAGIYFGTRHARRERELEHAERLKALETGQTLPKDAPFWTPNTMGLALAVVMPGALFLLALISSSAEPELMPYVWTIAGALGGIGIICGTLLALLLPRVAESADRRAGGAKVATDPDAFDVVSSRAWGEDVGSHRN